MPTSHPPYLPEFRVETIRLMRSSGKSLARLARELNISSETLRLWRTQADLNDGLRQDGLTSDERDELRRLRRENQVLRDERAILKQAAAFFAKETDARR